MRDTQRGSHEKEEREIEMSRRRKGGTQEERDRSMQLSVPIVVSVAQTPTQSHRIGLGREGGKEEIEVF